MVLAPRDEFGKLFGRLKSLPKLCLFPEQLKVPGRTRIPSASQIKRQSSVGRAIDSSTVTSCSGQRNTSKMSGYWLGVVQNRFGRPRSTHEPFLLPQNKSKSDRFKSDLFAIRSLGLAVQDW